MEHGEYFMVHGAWSMIRRKMIYKRVQTRDIGDIILHKQDLGMSLITTVLVS